MFHLIGFWSLEKYKTIIKQLEKFEYVTFLGYDNGIVLSKCSYDT